MSLMTRYILELSIVIPAAVFAFLPVLEDVKISPVLFFVAAGIFLTVFIIGGSYLCLKYVRGVDMVFIPGMLLLFAAYCMCVDLSFTKKLFCFSNAVMLCTLCPMYAITIMAPYELTNILWSSARLFTFESCLVYLGIALLIGVVFLKTLRVKLAVLLHEERVNIVWKFLCLFPLSMAVLIKWIIPVSPMVVITGRVRQISLVLMLILPAAVYMLYHLLWWTTVKFVDSAKLQQENNLLQMENKRYNALRRYTDETRILRHDFRQHLLVIAQLTKAGSYFELDEYVSQLTDKTQLSYKEYCANNAIDALASHYDAIAKSQDTNINWNFELPASLPIKDSDYCALLGNLVENALRAVKTLAPEQRVVKVISRMLSDTMLAISIDNPYEGQVVLGKNGLPVSQQEGHGIGLISVSNIVNRHGGSLNINTENQIFSVDIILF